jgi:hypothetical protein
MELLAILWALSVLLALLIGFGFGKALGHDEGWDEAANMRPEQLKMVKRLLERRK